ncbi:hypothetical protein [Streptomyces sp. NPDC097610]|uniref:hypothetical protein n=1 Tax=Streptomyces sp. NPDC097610 TaxID=3157227 RepID=UPI00332D9DCC
MGTVTTRTTAKPIIYDPDAKAAELHRQFDALGSALAAALDAAAVEGGSWGHEAGHASYGTVELRHPRGLGFTLVHEGSYRKGAAGRRLSVRGIYPRDSNVRRAEPITVSMDRDPTAMVRDIVRRWLPAYLATIDQALEMARTAECERVARRAMNRRMEQVLPGLHNPHVSDYEAPHRDISWWSGAEWSPKEAPARASGKVRLSGDARTANLELTGVPADLVLDILALIDGRQPLEGIVSPRAVAPAREELPASPPLTIPGELVPSAPAAIAEPIAREDGSYLLF